MNGQDCEQLTLFQADSPASPFPWLESKRAKGMTATCGLKCSELSESLRRVGYLVRTYLESCELPPGTWSRTWSARAMTSRCLILKLRLSARSTGERESPLWPTPDTQNARNGNTMRKDAHGRHGVSLHHAVAMWPTPRASEYKGCGPIGNKSAEAWNKQGYLTARALYSLFPTPRAQSATGPSEAPNCQGSADLQTVAGGQLNPTWVEWLMGFPLGWTDLSASETP